MAEVLRFFDHFLRCDDAPAPLERRLFYYTVGEERWKATTTWPLPGERRRRWYLAEADELTTSPPTCAGGADEYSVDFRASSGRHNRWHTELDEGYVDYRDRRKRDASLLCYTSAPLEADLEITGHPIVNLHVTSTATDGAFYVYLEEVDETGRVYYLTEGQLRALHRKVSDAPPPYRMLVPYHSFKREDAQRLRPGEPAELTFGLLPISALIRRGHRLRVAISCHDDGNFVRIPESGHLTIRLLRNVAFASFVDCPVISAP